MRRNLIYKFLLVCLIGSLSSCKDFLEEIPKNATHVGEFWSSPNDVSSAVAGNYALLRDAITSGNFNHIPRHFIYADGVPGNYFTIQYSGDGLESVQDGDFTWRYTVESYGDWTKYYKAITMSNLVLEKVPEMDVDLFTTVSNPTRFKNDALGQAYFIRALSYFMLTRTWGDVPLVLSTEEDPINAHQLGRTAKDQIMEQVEKDCHEAANLLDWTYSSQNVAKVTANKGSVYALLAHLYLWRATTTDLNSSQPIMEDINSADTCIAAIKSLGNYSEVDTANYYNTFIGKSSEGIFEIAADEAHFEGSFNHIAMQFLRQAHISYRGPAYSRFFVNPSYLQTHYKAMGTGEIEWVWVEGDWVWNEEAWQWDWVDAHWQEREATMDAPSDIRYIKNFTDLNMDQPTCIKYQNVNYRAENNAYISNNIIVFRYSDMLLLEAEIALYKDDPSKAIDIINRFRLKNDAYAEHGGLLASSLSKDEVFYEYAIERGKEMYLEGHLYYDLIRTRQYAEFIPWLTPQRFAQGGFYWPVSLNLFRNNSELTQTSYWIGRL